MANFELTMPGKCKFQDAWLKKDIYKDWLMRDVNDIHSARCRACCKFIKLQTMGEAALTSHAGGAGHKVAVRKLVEGNAQALYRLQNPHSIIKSQQEEESIQQCLPCESNFLSIDGTGQVNGCVAQVKGTFWPKEERQRPGHSQPEVRELKSEVKDPPQESLEWSEVNNKNSTFHNSELQDPAFTATFITATGCATKRLSRRGRPPSKPDISDSGTVLSRLEQQRNMALLEWEGRMKNLSQEQELLAEKRRATQQKERAYRLKKRYYRAKLRRLGEDVPSSSDSEQDEGQRVSVTGHGGIL